MYAANYIFGVARRLVQEEGDPILLEDRDVFSTSELSILYEDVPCQVWWSEGIAASKKNRMLDVERIEITSGYTEEETGQVIEELEVVYQGIYTPDDGKVETFYYVPDAWAEYLEQRAKSIGVIS